MDLIQDHLAEVIDEANEGIYVTDKDRRFVLWNKAAERIAGYAKHEVIGRPCHDNLLSHVDSEGRELCFNGCPLHAAIDDGSPHGPAVVYMRHKSGKRIAVEVRTAAIRGRDGAVIGAVEVFQDVTERLEREQLLLERKEKLETVLDSIGDGILFLDATGSIAVVNRVCAAMFGLTSEATGSSLFSHAEQSLIGQAFDAVEKEYERSMRLAVERTDARCPEGKGRFRCWTAAIDRSAFAPHSPCYTCPTYRAARAFLEKPHELQYDERTIAAVSSFIELSEVNDLWEVIVFHDVTAEKLDASLKVAGAAAHELRQPLQALVMTADLLGQELKGNKKYAQYLAVLQEGCKRINGIIEQMNQITAYRTKQYIGGTNILDIERSSQKP
jgi:PAS domain S-box-containing protein